MRVFTVAALAIVGLVLTAVPSSAATANWQGEVGSNGAVKVFETQRVASQWVQNKVTGTAEAGISLVACANFNTVSGEWQMPLGVTRTFGATTNKCFRQSIRRWSAKDTNGILPGMGVTTMYGNIIW